MRLTRVFVPVPLHVASTIELPPETAAHVVKVLRARAGDELVLFNGDGRDFSGVVGSIRGKHVSVEIGADRPVDNESPLAVTLVQCVARGEKMDFIVQKATELGVARIAPVLSQRSVVKLDEAQAQSKQAHWQAVAVSACEQSGRARVPTVQAPVPLLNFLGALPSASHPRFVLEPHTAAKAVQAAAGAVDIAIGPEGGFAPDELEAFGIAGFTPVGLGPRVLRTETAAIAALVWLQTRFGDLT